METTINTTTEISANYQPTDSYLRVATACPEVSLADVASNISRISQLYHEAAAQQAALVVFPELSITGYTIGDLVQQKSLLDQAEQGIQQLAEITRGKPTAMVVGLPLRVQNGLYNCAAVLADGHIKGLVPKTHLPTYNEFYERRWYDSWPGPDIDIQIESHQVTFGADMLFAIGGIKLGVEICEDLWVAQPISTRQAQRGAQIIANPSASPEQIGKADYRRNLVAIHSAQILGGYLYAGCDTSESTADIVMGGHQLIASSGAIQAERRPFAKGQLLISDIDVDHLDHDRRRQHMAQEIGVKVIISQIKRQQTDLRLEVEAHPFLPATETATAQAERLEMALNIQAHGLAVRMQASQQNRLVLGLSGGLDSTLAVLIACRAAALLGKPPSDMIHTLTMPGPASSGETQLNAQRLARQLSVHSQTIPIGELVSTELACLGHDGRVQDITYENVQARARTSLLFNYANQQHAMVLGTGDLSEIALGWCTYNGDQQSHYNVNASIPKTLVKHLVQHVSHQPEFAAAAATLQAIIATVVSPELTRQQGSDISQSTEAMIGPYILHDFFLYHLVRWGDTPTKIQYLAEAAFAGSYQPAEITNWLNVFLSRFVRNQFKRENLPNGPKVGSVSLSPRGDWRMPPDLRNGALWQ